MRDAVPGIALALAAALATGCVTRADLVQRDQRIIRVLREHRRQIEAVEREVERLRGDVEGGAVRPARDASSIEERIAALERRVYAETPPETIGPDGEPGTAPTDVGAGGVAALPSAPHETPLMAAWEADVRAEVDRARGANAPGLEEYVEALGDLERRNCASAVAKLDRYAATHRDSPLADNALYWAARCYVLMGDSTPGRSTEFYNQAISKFYDVGTSYPKGEMTPAALLEQGELFIRIGDVPDARIVFSRLIRDHPGSREAAVARQRLVEIGR